MKEVSDGTVCSVLSELKNLGVKVPKVKKFKSCIPKHVREVSSISDKIFGVPIYLQEKISVADYVLPKFVFTSASYLKKYSAVEIGLFRKAGSVKRQRDLRAKLERGENIEEFEPNDVASLLKQWLRELPEPLIPVYLQDLFIRCQKLQVEENRIAALLLCCHLLPFEHLHTLKYLLELLSEIASNSDRNKMGACNLAVIMAPNIFVSGADSTDKSGLHTSILELLINNVQRIIVASPTKIPPLSKKKQRSGPVQETGLRCTSKRKADPEQLSLPALKKQATATTGLNLTPDNRCYIKRSKLRRFCQIFRRKKKQPKEGKKEVLPVLLEKEFPSLKIQFHEDKDDWVMPILSPLGLSPDIQRIFYFGK